MSYVCCYMKSQQSAASHYSWLPCQDQDKDDHLVNVNTEIKGLSRENIHFPCTEKVGKMSASQQAELSGELMTL